MMKTEINDVIDEKNFIKTKLLLYRNLSKFPYVSKLRKNEGKEICLIIESALSSIKGNTYKVTDLSLLDEVERKILLENFSISQEAYNNYGFSKLIVFESEDLIIEINGKEHITVKMESSPDEFKDKCDMVYELLSKLEELLKFQFDENLGYLTSDIYLLGTALKVIDVVKIGFIKENIGNLLLKFPITLLIKGKSYIINNFNNSKIFENLNVLQIENKRTIGEDEAEIISDIKNTDKLNSVIEYLTKYYNNQGYEDLHFEDKVGRAIGLLKYGKVIEEKEGIDALLTMYKYYEKILKNKESAKELLEKIYDIRKYHLCKNLEYNPQKKEKDIELNIIRGKYLNDLFSEEEVDFNGFAK